MVLWYNRRRRMTESMNSLHLLAETIFFAFALWLGLYLISRNIGDIRLALAGLGLVAYSAGLALDALISVVKEPQIVANLASWRSLILFAPGMFWLALLISLIPGDRTIGERLRRHPKPWSLVFVASIFFFLGIGFIFFPLEWLPPIWVLLAVGADLLLLGLAMANLDASDEGQRLLPHFSRSLTYAFFASLIFGGQVGLAMAISTGVTPPMYLLLLTTLTAAIALQTFSGKVQSALDGLSFYRFPLVRQTSAQLQIASDVVSRVDESLDMEALDDKEFARLTRRALSYMGDLPKLASSPLTRIALIEHRLRRNGSPAATLERASELKAILADSIERLKPRGQGDFGRSDAWRHYNALYYPYVLGLKPYSRRASGEKAEGSEREALDWFRAEVPQRTLYNWQNAAAQLVAQDLRERSMQLRD
jgi:hypothetical protein